MVGSVTAPAPEASPHASGRSWLLAVLLVLVVGLTYANAIQNGFVFDDVLLIVDQPNVRAPIGEILERPSYRPLRTLSYRLDYAIGGMEPWIFHLSNVVYHGVAVLLVFAVLEAAGASPVAAAAGALLFAVHPVQTDAVTYASGRRDVLCGLFFAAGFLAFLAHRRTGSTGMMIAAVVAFLLAILSKEMAVTLPLVCVAWVRFAGGRDVVPGSTRAPSGRLLGWIAALGGAGLVVFLVTYGRHLRRVLTRVPWHGGSIGTNLATVARIWVHYLGLLVFPATLSADYSFDAFPVSTSAFDPRALASVALLVVLAFGARRAWRAGSLVGFGAAWWAVTLLPVSHVIPYSELLAEHYLYTPMIGVAFVVAGAVDWAAVRFPARRRVLAVVVAIVVAAAAWRTVVRNRDWRDADTLWSATVAAVPGCARAHFNLGQSYFQRTKLVEAEREWLTAASIRPDEPDTEIALAKLYHRLARHEEATRHIDAALALRPGDPQAQELAGWIALNRGEPRVALAYFDAALVNLKPEENETARTGRARAAQALQPSLSVQTVQPRGPGAAPGTAH